MMGSVCMVRHVGLSLRRGLSWSRKKCAGVVTVLLYMLPVLLTVGFLPTFQFPYCTLTTLACFAAWDLELRCKVHLRVVRDTM